MTEDRDSVCFNLHELLEVTDGRLQPEPLGPAGFDVLGYSVRLGTSYVLQWL